MTTRPSFRAEFKAGEGGTTAVYILGEFDPKARTLKEMTSPRQLFGTMGDAIKNETTGSVWVRLIMNDNRPQDNVGNARVWYRKVPMR